LDLLKTSEQSEDPVLPYFLEKYTTGTTGNTEGKLYHICIASLVPEFFAGHQGFDGTYERLAGLAIYKGSRLLK
jgi:hypothetical protein